MDSVAPASVTAATRVAYGCMRIAGDGSAEARRRGLDALDAAYEAGIRHFDNADIYGGGECEALFGEWLHASPGLRRELTLTGKCGIRLGDGRGPQHYDLSPEHIERSVDASLARLGTDTLDLLLLHRPDYLMDPEAVGREFERLETSGRVRGFGVSNFRASQLRMLQRRIDTPILVNQLEFSLAAPDALDNGDLDACLELGVVPQAWSPLGGAVPGHPRSAPNGDRQTAVGAELRRQAAARDVEPWQIALAWVLHPPAGCPAVIGSLTPARIAGAVAAAGIDYSRLDWYRLLEATRGHPVP